MMPHAAEQFVNAQIRLILTSLGRHLLPEGQEQARDHVVHLVTFSPPVPPLLQRRKLFFGSQGRLVFQVLAQKQLLREAHGGDFGIPATLW